MTVDFDEAVRPSPEAETVLRHAGWSPDRSADISEWVETLGREGNHVFPLARVIMERFGRLRLRHQGFGGPACHDFQINPDSWYDERDHVALIEEVLKCRLWPIGETSGAAMLAVLEDGRVIAELDGLVLQIARNWSEALDHFILGRGETMLLAEDYDQPVHPPRPWRP